MRETNTSVINMMGEAMNILADLESRYSTPERTEIFKRTIKSNYENIESVDTDEFITDILVGLRSLKKNL